MINSIGSLAAQAQAASATTTSTPPSTSSSSTSVTDPLANQNVFLQLLVAQLENQDPESPADGTEFITQLAQFSQLSDSAQMLSDLDAIKQSLATGTNPPTTNTSGTNTSGTSSTPASS